jgi:cell wall-associated NlpC family hydrolase
MKFLSFAVALFLVSCAATPESGHIPGPAAKVKRSETMTIAYAYTTLSWTPLNNNSKHGTDSRGILVHTPDHKLSDHGFSNGWWKPGQTNTGMPYQWGGFDTPHSFLHKIKRGYAAGDISTAAKRAGGDAVVSESATGIDCSGFVSRCWRLSRPYSTAQLPAITQPITWGQLLPGDILLNNRHVLLFAGWQKPGSVILAYEAGPYPLWKVSSNAIPTERLFADGYQPRRYHHIITDTP